jgi:uncharacterized membrane protein
MINYIKIKTKYIDNTVIKKGNITMKKNTNNKLDIKKLVIIAASAIVVIAIAFSIKLPGSKTEDTTKRASDIIETVKDKDVIIPIKNITEKASFYPVEIGGTKLEVIAVKAPDGSVRTAFNTCQVCYSSGRGYYEQEGDQLICQNCGNAFGMSDVEVTKGGCNPVPISSEFKTVSEDEITISKDVLEQASVIFTNWK